MDNFEVRWQNVENLLMERFGKLPDFEGTLYLIGINELGYFPKEHFSKEQKQDLMHIGVCTLLERRGYYRFYGRDADGWLHFETLKPVEVKGLLEQERMLKECMIEYFNL